MSRAEIKINKIKAKNKVALEVLKDVVKPEVLHAAVPRLAEVQEARVEHRNKMNEIQQWGKYHNTPGFDPHGVMQYVAQIDQAVWAGILDTFARHDPETGELMDDGLLYITDQRGNLILNRDFFYTIIQELQSAGYECDMRGKVKVH